MEPVKGYNLYNTAYSSAKLMAYFEEHGMLDIVLKLFLEIVHKRPIDVKKYISENIKRIAANVQSTRTVILLPPMFDTQQLVRLFKEFYNIPTVMYTKKRKPGDAKEILEKFKKFLCYHKLDRKHKIFINFPRNCEESAIFKQNDLEPTSVIEVRHGFQVPFKTREMMVNEKVDYTKEFKEVEDFYKEVFHSIKFASRADCSEPERHKLNQTVRDITDQLVGLMRNITPKRNEHANGRFCYRIVIVGRRGAGRKTQAIALARRFELVYINTEKLIVEYLSSPCALGDILRQGLKENNQISTISVAAVIYKRILQKDCLSNGWVIVGFPYNLEGFKLVYKFIVKPNKIIFLHCRERVGIRRIIRRGDRDIGCSCIKRHCCDHRQRPQNSTSYIYKEMEYFNLNKKEILEYLVTKKETIHVDGNHSSETVRKFIWAQIEQHQHNIGMARRT